MGTLNWEVSTYARGGKTLPDLNSAGGSGAFTTSTSAGNVTSLTLQAGTVLDLTASEDMWVNGNGTAVVGTGKFLPAGVPKQYEVGPELSGNSLSAIDVA